MKRAILIGADGALGSRLKSDLLAMDWSIGAAYTKDAPAGAVMVDPLSQSSFDEAAKALAGPADLLLINIDQQWEDDAGTILDPMDMQRLIDAYSVNTLGVLRAIHAFLPALQQGGLKRIGVVTTKDASVNLCEDSDNYRNHLSRAPLNMALTQLFNRLRPEGFTFRVYCRDIKGGHDEWAADFFARGRSNEPESPRHSDENRIVLRDWRARELPW